MQASFDQLGRSKTSLSAESHLISLASLQLYRYILHFTLVSVVTGGYYIPYTDRKL